MCKLYDQTFMLKKEGMGMGWRDSEVGQLSSVRPICYFQQSVRTFSGILIAQKL